ncbi:unnamed protein product [Alternaria alternata]
MLQTALVTGGTGFIALYVVKTLLEHGHHVHTTVRSLVNEKKCKPLLDLQTRYPDKLTLSEADLLSDWSFFQAMQGCDTVYHIASPFLVPQQIKDGMKDCVEPALNGTRNVLAFINDTDSVKRVVLTSSIVAMYGDSIDVHKLDNKTLSEEHWNTTSTATNNPYNFSKVGAEREAWKIYEAQNRWELVVINLGFIVGPSLSSESVSGSLFMLEAMYRGGNKMGVVELYFSVVDVRDVAQAHVVVGEDTPIEGRFIVASDRSSSLLDMANAVRPVHKTPGVLPTRNFPNLMIHAAGPFMGLPMRWISKNVGIAFKVDNSRRVKELKIKYRPLGNTIADHYNEWCRNSNSN